LDVIQKQADALTNLRGEPAKNRYAFIDILKIVGILFVLAEHLGPYYVFPFTNYLNVALGKMYEFNFGSIGITLFLLASGCSLYLTHPTVGTRQQAKDFYLKRGLRIYPIYWLAIVFALVWQPFRLQQTFIAVDMVKLVSGFQSLGAQSHVDFWGLVNGNFWFLTILLSLYLLYPVISLAFKKNPHATFALLIAISIVSRYVMSNAATYFMGIYWMPLCWLPEFALGIYLLKLGVKPKTQSTKMLLFFGNFSFYLYLINQPILQSFNLEQNILLFGVILFFCGCLFYFVDKNSKQALPDSYAKSNKSKQA
jgi:peptidoglycan/LPS O-acetylase OafA/YrhL